MGHAVRRFRAKLKHVDARYAIRVRRVIERIWPRAKFERQKASRLYQKAAKRTKHLEEFFHGHHQRTMDVFRKRHAQAYKILELLAQVKPRRRGYTLDEPSRIRFERAVKDLEAYDRRIERLQALTADDPRVLQQAVLERKEHGQKVPAGIGTLDKKGFFLQESLGQARGEIALQLGLFRRYLGNVSFGHAP